MEWTSEDTKKRELLQSRTFQQWRSHVWLSDVNEGYRDFLQCARAGALKASDVDYAIRTAVLERGLEYEVPTLSSLGIMFIEREPELFKTIAIRNLFEFFLQYLHVCGIACQILESGALLLIDDEVRRRVLGRAIAIGHTPHDMNKWLEALLQLGISKQEIREILEIKMKMPLHERWCACAKYDFVRHVLTDVVSQGSGADYEYYAESFAALARVYSRTELMAFLQRCIKVYETNAHCFIDTFWLLAPTLVRLFGEDVAMVFCKKLFRRISDVQLASYSDVDSLPDCMRIWLQCEMLRRGDGDSFCHSEAVKWSYEVLDREDIRPLLVRVIGSLLKKSEQWVTLSMQERLQWIGVCDVFPEFNDAVSALLERFPVVQAKVVQVRYRVEDVGILEPRWWVWLEVGERRYWRLVDVESSRIISVGNTVLVHAGAIEESREDNRKLCALDYVIF
jgi:hypothetical protein